MNNKKKLDTITITKMASVIAIVGLLGLTPIGYIKILELEITTLHAITIIIAILLGKREGVIAGLTFGITSIITAITQGGLFAPIFFNPIVSVLPRVILPLAAYYIFKITYKIIHKKITLSRVGYVIAAITSAGISTVLHTGLVLIFIWIFRWMSPELTAEVLWPIILTLLSINMTSEIVVAMILSGIIVPTLYPWFNKEERISEN